MGLLQVPKAPSPGSKGQICPPYYTFGPRSLGPEQKTAISSRRLTRTRKCWQPHVRGVTPILNSIYNGSAWTTSRWT